MNQKINTLLFIIAASVGNIVVMIVLMTLLLAAASAVVPAELSPAAGQILFLLVFAASIGGSFFIYHRFVRFLSKRIDMDRYFHPIFRGRRPQ